MKQTPESNLYNRANTPAGSGAINGQQWRNVPPPVQQAPRQDGRFPWRLFILTGAVVWIISAANRPKTAQERSGPPQVQSIGAVPERPPQGRVERALRVAPRVERALPVFNKVPRAEAVSSGPADRDWVNNPANVGNWAVMNIPGEGNVWVHFRGRIADADSLPAGAALWDWYLTPEGTSWVYMTSAATGQLGWIDP